MSTTPALIGRAGRDVVRVVAGDQVGQVDQQGDGPWPIRLVVLIKRGTGDRVASAHLVPAVAMISRWVVSPSMPSGQPSATGTTAMRTAC